MKKLSILFGLLIIVAISITACSPKAEEPIVSDQTPQPNYLIVEGSLVPAHYLDQSFNVPGMVTEVLVKDGDTVEIGQVVAKMDIPYEAYVAFSQSQLEVQNAQLALDSLKSTAESSLAQSRLDVFNAKTLAEEALEDFDADDSEENELLLDVASANLESAKQKLSTLEEGNGIDPDIQKAAETRVNTAMTAMLAAQSVIDSYQLKANVGGTVANLQIEPGERIAAGVPVLTVVDFSNWQIKTDNLTEINVVNVEVGQKVEVVLDALPEKTFNGEVSQISKIYEEKRGDVTFTATITLSETDPQMRWGMTAAVSFLP